MTDSIDRLTAALSAAARAFLKELDQTARVPRDRGTEPHGSVSEGVIEYDPLHDAPPLPARPNGDLNERRMKDLAYLGAIARINGEYGRGATKDEVAHHARLAGYSGGNAVTGWNSTAKSVRAIENVNGQRVLNASGHDYVRQLASDLGIRLKGDTTPLEILP